MLSKKIRKKLKKIKIFTTVNQTVRSHSKNRVFNKMTYNCHYFLGFIPVFITNLKIT